MPGAEESPAISPDGKTVAFVAARAASGKSGWGRPITKDDADHFGPRWAPDSKSLIYFAAGAIWEIPAAGGEARKLVDALGSGRSEPRWQTRVFPVAGWRVELMVDAQVIVKLSGGGTYSNLRWSPDDKKIAYLQDSETNGRRALPVASPFKQPISPFKVSRGRRITRA